MKKLTKQDIMDFKDKEELNNQFQKYKKAYKKAKEDYDFSQDDVEEQSALQDMNTAKANVKLIKEYLS